MTIAAYLFYELYAFIISVVRGSVYEQYFSFYRMMFEGGVGVFLILKWITALLVVLHLFPFLRTKAGFQQITLIAVVLLVIFQWVAVFKGDWLISAIIIPGFSTSIHPVFSLIGSLISLA
ncbi:MAG: hypothetical protein AAFV80_13470, partial [Bacteroidota bacterium]